MTKGFTTEVLLQLFKMFKDELKQKIDNVLLEIGIEPFESGHFYSRTSDANQIADIINGKVPTPNVINLVLDREDHYCTGVEVAYADTNEKRLYAFLPEDQKLTDWDGNEFTNCWLGIGIQDSTVDVIVIDPLEPVSFIQDVTTTFLGKGPVVTIPCAENKHSAGLGLVKGAAPSASTNRTSANVYVVKQKGSEEAPDGDLSALRYETVTFSLLGTAPQSFAKDSNCYVTGEAFLRHYYTSTAYTKVTPIVGNTYFDTAKKIAYVWTGETMLPLTASSAEKEPLVITLNITENTGTKISAIANTPHGAIKQAMLEGRRCYWYAPQLNDAIAEVTGVQDAATGMIVYNFTDNGAVTMMFVRQQAQFVTVLIREL